MGQPVTDFFANLIAKATALLLVLCLATMMWGHLNPYDYRADTFHICNMNPCFFGIEPGFTSWDEVFDKLFLLEGDIQVYENRIRISLNSGDTIVIDQSSDGQFAGRVYVSFSGQSPFAVGWVVERYGIPCGVSYYRENMVALRYPKLVVNTVPPNSLFDPFAAVSNIQFSDPSFHPEFVFDPCEDNASLGVSNQPWQGFYASRRYHSSYSR